MSQTAPPDPPGSDAAKLGSEDVLPLYQERVAVTRRRVPTQLVRATRTTRSHDHRIEETLSHERVIVERIAIGQIVAAMPPVRQEGDVTIMPVVEEQLVLRKQLFLKEEIRIKRITVTQQHVETVTLREQQAAVTRNNLDNDSAVPNATTQQQS